MTLRRNESGYTIIEMMIVIVIIGVLVSIAIPSYNGLLERAKKTACQANQRSIELARAFYAIKNGDYGSSISDIDVAFDEIGFTGEGTKEDLLCPSGGTYLFVTGKFYINCSIENHNN